MILWALMPTMLALDSPTVPLHGPNDVRVLRKPPRMIGIGFNRVHLEAMVRATGDGIEHVVARGVTHVVPACHFVDGVLHPREPKLADLEPIRVAQDSAEARSHPVGRMTAPSPCQKHWLLRVVYHVGDVSADAVAEHLGRNVGHLLHSHASLVRNLSWVVARPRRCGPNGLAMRLSLIPI